MVYIVKFSDGKEVVTNSEEHYTHAWQCKWTRAWDGKTMVNTGFSTSAENAATEASKCHSYVDHKRWKSETYRQKCERIKRETDEMKRSIESQCIEIVALKHNGDMSVES